eukprot:4930171-Alexandrium_andersonii.AAC.1
MGLLRWSSWPMPGQGALHVQHFPAARAVGAELYMRLHGCMSGSPKGTAAKVHSRFKHFGQCNNCQRLRAQFQAVS